MTTKTETKQDLKKKKKKWITLLASKEFNNQEIGETYIEEEQQAVGRVVEANLMMLTKDPKKQNFKVYFRVVSAKDNLANTELFKYSIQVAQLKRITKKGKNKIDDSFIYKTKDNKKITIKPILTTRVLAYKTKLKLVRKVVRDFLIEYTKNNAAQNIMKEIVNNNLQKEIKNHAKKILPMVNTTIKSAIIND